MKKDGKLDPTSFFGQYVTGGDVWDVKELTTNGSDELYGSSPLGKYQRFTIDELQGMKRRSYGIRAGAKYYEGKTRAEAVEAMRRDMETIFPEGEDTYFSPMVVRAGAFLVFMWRTDSGWQYKAVLPDGFEPNKPDTLLGYSGARQSRYETQKAMVSHVAQMVMDLDNPEPGREFIRSMYKSREKEQEELLRDYDDYLKWQVGYRNLERQGLSDAEIRQKLFNQH